MTASAKATLRSVYVSYDAVNDERYRAQLESWSAGWPYVFSYSVSDPRSCARHDVEETMRAIQEAIDHTRCTLALVGERSNEPHEAHAGLGYRNWANYEIAVSKARHRPIIALKVRDDYESPDELLGAGATWVFGFCARTIEAALSQVLLD